jgi:LuxR family glucitol operon transcriptional activator
MAEIENHALFAEYLYSGVASLKSHPSYKTRRRRREMSPSGVSFSESYLDKIAAQLGISPNTLKSWIGLMGLKYVPGRVEDSKLFGLLWIILKHSDMQSDWFSTLLKTTSIPVLEPPTPDWIKACLKKAKTLLPNDTFGNPEEEEIDRVVERLFSPEVLAGPPAAEPAPALPNAPAYAREAVGVHHNLPTRWSNLFVGRKATLDILNKWLHSASPLCLITGWGGMGKSTIALEAAYACLGEARGEAAKLESPWPSISCAIWVSADLKGLSFNFFLDTIAYQLGKVELIGQSENEKQFVVRNALANYSRNGTILLIVDNLDASDRDILSFLANLPPRTKAIITSRDHQQKLFHNVSRDLFTIQIGGMDKEDALHYLRQETQYHIATSVSERKRENLQQLLESDNDILMQLIDAANGNPKALSLSIAYIADDVIPVQAFIREMQSVGYSLSSLFEYLFGHTWERCHDDVQRLWMVLPLFQTPPDEMSWAAAAGLDRMQFHQAVDQMRAYSLIATERSDEQLHYRAHQTVIFYGEQKLRENPSFKNQALSRLADYYLNFVESRLGRQQIEHIYWKCLPGNDYAPVKKQWPNLYKLLKWFDESGQDAYLTAFMLRLSHFLSRISLPLRIRFGIKAAEAAGRLGRKLEEALFRIDTAGWANFEIGHMEDGLEQLELGLAIVEDASWETPDPEDRKERNDLRSLAIQFKARYFVDNKQLDRARALLKEAMSIPISPVILHRALLLKGQLEMLDHNWEQAVRSLEEANEASLTYGGEKSIESYYLLGTAYLCRGQFDKARKAFESFLPDASVANQIELIYYEYGMAQLLAGQNQVIEAINLLISVLNRIDSWEPGIRIRQEVKAFHDQLLEHTPAAAGTPAFNPSGNDGSG